MDTILDNGVSRSRGFQDVEEESFLGRRQRLRVVKYGNPSSLISLHENTGEEREARSTGNCSAPDRPFD